MPRRARQVGAFLLCPWAWCLFGLTLAATGWLGRGSAAGLFVAGAASVTVFVAIGFQAIARRRTTLLRDELERFAAESADVRIMLASLPGMIWQSDRSLGRVFVSSRWLATTGQTLDEALGDGWLEAVHPGDRERCRAAQRLAASEREPFEVQYRLRGPDGAYRLVGDRAAPCFDDGGAFAGYAGFGVEVAAGEVGERALEAWAERALRANQSINDRAVALADRFDELEAAAHHVELRDRAKSEFLAALAAELREPAEEARNAIELLSAAHSAANERDPIDRVHRALARFEAVAQRTAHLSAGDDEAEPVAPGKFDLRRLVEQSAKRHARRAEAIDAEVSRLVENEVPAVVKADPLATRSLLTDVWAAVMAHAADGRVTLRVGRESHAGGSVVVHFGLTLVSPGISPALLERAFYPTEAVGDDEPGLGLAGPRQLAERMGGRLGVEQTRPGHTLVWFALPVEPINPNFDGRRAHSRLPQESLACSLGTVLDLSLGGIRVQTNRAPEGTVDLELADDEERVELKADVCWTRRVGFARHEAGLRFRGLTPEVTARISRLATRNRLRRALAA